MTNKEKRTSAEELYMLGFRLVQISRLLSVSETSLSIWSREGNWRIKRAERAARKKTRVESVEKIIDYMLECMENEVDERRSNGGKLVSIDKGEIDATVKLFSAIRGKELTLAAVVDLIRQFISFMRERNPDLAKELIPYTDDFVLTKQDELG